MSSVQPCVVPFRLLQRRDSPNRFWYIHYILDFAMILVSIIPRYPKTHLINNRAADAERDPDVPSSPSNATPPRWRSSRSRLPCSLPRTRLRDVWRGLRAGDLRRYSELFMEDWVGFHGRFHGRFHGVSVWDIWMAYFYGDFSSSPNFCTPSQQLGGCGFLGISELSRLCQSIDSTGD